MKIISLNIERDKHYDRVIDFITRENPDVLCLMEVLDQFLPKLTELGYNFEFLPLTIRGDLNNQAEGICIASKETITNAQHKLYRKPHDEIVLYVNHNKPGTHRHGYILADIAGYTIGTTHFTWTPDGATPNDAQREDAPKFIKLISEEKPHVMTGDFNIPRHFNPLYEDFCKHYTDVVPAEYTTSLDKSLHRLGTKPEKANLFSDYMVDYLFIQEPYIATDVRLEFGVSDHAAVVGTLEKIST